jgi:transketolase
VDVSTGPLGQGFANAVGMAIAETYLSHHYNRLEFDIINHFTYCLVSDGDLMEGVCSEAASLAGHLRLGKLIVLYDSNHIMLSGATLLAFTEDVLGRFFTYGWHTQLVSDGNDVQAIHQALEIAQAETEKPSIIEINTHIAYGAPHKQDTYQAHGSPLGAEEIRLAKKNLGWPEDTSFLVPSEVADYFHLAVDHGYEAEKMWQQKFENYKQQYPALYQELKEMLEGKLTHHWSALIPQFEPTSKGISTREAGGKVLDIISPKLPALIGGSADLNASTHTELTNGGNFEEGKTAVSDIQGKAGGVWNYEGKNIHYGVREHAMGAISNGLAAHGGIIPFTATFLTFSDYMRPAIRLAALSKLHVIFVFTHDSIGLGEDGPTHQPIEHLAVLRAIPDLMVIRPADANETAIAWQVALETKNSPVALIFSRQSLPVIDQQKYNSAHGLRQGAYIVSGCSQEKPDVILMGTGSELHLLLEAKEILTSQGLEINVVSMPCWELFNQQPEAYRNSVLPPDVTRRLAVEAGIKQGWEPYLGCEGVMISLEHFGASAPGEIVQQKFGFTVEHVLEKIHSLLKKDKL